MGEKPSVVLASANTGKLRELQELLAGLDLVLLPQAHFAVPEAAETGLSFVENAIIKARNAAHYSGLPAIADDSGLQVDILQGAPGIYSARYAGAGAGDPENLDFLIRQIKAEDAAQPAARFQCVMVYIRHADDAMPIIAQGTWEGYIITEPRGGNGFGYDPVFYVPSHQCTSAELPATEKNRISHRGQAMQQLLAALENTAHLQDL
jgi:XTP/dITP diphosphohydrolase